MGKIIKYKGEQLKDVKTSTNFFVVYLDDQCQAQENPMTIFHDIITKYGRNLSCWKHTSCQI
jgi:hypothetical protein